MKASIDDTRSKAVPKVALAFMAAGFGFLILPIADAIGKVLGASDINPIQIAWGRWIANAVIMAPIVIAIYGVKRLRPNDIGLQFWRSVGLIGATICFFFALATDMPLPSVTATLFLAPLLVTALSGLTLGEKVGPLRWSAVGIGFCGMLLIVRPESGEMQLGSIFALGAATCFAGYLLLTRRVAGRTPPMVSTLWMGIFGVIVCSMLVAPVYKPFSQEQWIMIGIMGAILTFGHLLILWAADHLEASAMAPMPYLEMVTSTLLGLFFFKEYPALTTWIGVGFVIGGGLFVAWRESQKAKALQPRSNP